MRALLASVVAMGALAAAGVADAETHRLRARPDTHTFVTSYDGIRLQVHLLRTDRRGSDGDVPVVMIAHGWGEAGPADPDGARLAGAPTVRPVLDAGYDVLTWDARGHGGSSGTAMLDSPRHEVRDVRAILTWLADQPGVELDRPGDPRVGMVGASYGGIIQFQVAAIDRRVDVIAPGYTGHDLARNALATHGKLKEAWALALAALGGVGNLPAGLTSPLGPQLHGIDPPAITGLLGSVARGTVTPAFRDYLAPRSPRRYLRRIDVPTLIQVGTPDTLFPADGLVRNYRALERRGIPVKMVWNCEGHSYCPGDAGPLESHFNSTVIRWMDRWLRRDRSVRTGPRFEWIADNEGHYRSAPDYPLRRAGVVRGTGSGQLPLVPTAPLSSGGFVLYGAQPATGPAVEVPIAAAGRFADVVGFPRLRMTYIGRAVPRHTWIYAQLVDDRTGRVVNSQITPVPVVLDGRRHTATVRLNAVATRADPHAHYRLQLLAGSLIFGLQRSTGTIDLRSVRVTLPIAAATQRG